MNSALEIMLFERFETMDYEQAKDDVRAFIANQEVLQLWSADYFQQISRRL